MKKIILAIIGYLPMTIWAQDKVIIQDANARVREISGEIREIAVSGGIDLYLSQDDDQKIAVSARTNAYRDKIVTKLNNGRLEISYPYKEFNFGPNMELKAYVSVKNLQKLIASGASDVHVNGILKSEAMEIILSGASNCSSALNVRELKLVQSGASDSKFSGKVSHLDAVVSGASTMKAFDLVAGDGSIKATGASEVKIHVSGNMTLEASGASDIKYKGGEGIREIKSTGASSVNKVS